VRHPSELALLAPHLDDLDEIIFLAHLFDLLSPRSKMRWWLRTELA